MAKKKILVVDDEPEFLDMIKMRLEASSYSAVIVSDPKEVFRTAEKETPDVILLDIAMSGMDGYQVCERLKEGKETKSIPIILLTGKELEPRGITERCLKLGANGFLLKPVDKEKLFAKIDEVLKEK